MLAPQRWANVPRNQNGRRTKTGMKLRVLASLAVGAMALSACGAAQEQADKEASPQADAAASLPEPDGAAPAEAPAASQNQPIAPGAPAFAVIYPGATLDAPPTLAPDARGSGGLATFLTAADPETVIAFYRQQAETTGLASVMAMNQGEAQAYGAAGTAGETLQVVASPTEQTTTSVQLTWSAGG